MAEPAPLPPPPPVQHAPTGIKTRILIASDTHGKDWTKEGVFPQEAVDVAMHCGDFTERSTLKEFEQARKAFAGVNAALKLFIPGDRDGTLDLKTFKKWYDDEHQQEHGYPGEAKMLFERPFKRHIDPTNGVGVCGQANIHLLGTGQHDFILGNGAKLRVYANSHVPSHSPGPFRFSPAEGHVYDIGEDVDVVITHGPPKGIRDSVTEQGEHHGCQDLMDAVAKAKPRLHCFGHISDAFGATMMNWITGEKEAAISDLDRDGYRHLSMRRDGAGPRRHYPLVPGDHTMFVNAAMNDHGAGLMEFPWVVTLDLPLARETSYATKYPKFFNTYWVSGKMPSHEC